jgi:large subunit ribosomal protein L29
MGDAELREKLQELRDELFRVRFRAASDPEANPGRIRTLRRDIARVRTVQRERDLSRARSAEGKGE